VHATESEKSVPAVRPPRAVVDRERRKTLPPAVKDAIRLMIWGNPEDPDAGPLEFDAAAKVAKIKPYLLRRKLDTPAARAFIRAERALFRSVICMRNEHVLAEVRDRSPNSMARVAAVKTLENLEEEHHGTSRGIPTMPGLCVIIGVDPARQQREQREPATITMTPSAPEPRSDPLAGQPRYLREARQRLEREAEWHRRFEEERR
jgi:hypothetical protein